MDLRGSPSFGSHTQMSPIKQLGAGDPEFHDSAGQDTTTHDSAFGDFTGNSAGGMARSSTGTPA